MVAADPLHELEGAGADGADGGRAVLVAVRLDERLVDHVRRGGRERVLQERIRLAERDDHGLRVGRSDIGHVGQHPADIRAELRVADAVEAVDHVIDGHGRAVVELDTLADLERVGQTVRADGPRRREVGAQLGVVLAEDEQWLGDAGGRQARHEVVVEGRVDRRRLTLDGGHDRASRRRGLGKRRPGTCECDRGDRGHHPCGQDSTPTGGHATHASSLSLRP